MCSLLLTLPIAQMSPQHPLIAPLICPTQFLSDYFPLVVRCRLIFVYGPTQMVGSETQKAVYYIGYHLIVTQACTHLLSSRSLEHPTFDLCPLILAILCLERLGLVFSSLYHPDSSSPSLKVDEGPLAEGSAVINSTSYSLLARVVRLCMPIASLNVAPAFTLPHDSYQW